MKTRLIIPLAAMLFGLSACTYQEAPYTGLQVQFSVGAPLYYSGGPVTWRYYNGYTYHLVDHHGRFVGYAYYDYDHFYRIADAYGNIVYFLRWFDGGWRIHNHRNRHLGFIRSDGHGNHWFAGLGGRRHGALRGWGSSGRHGHAHAARHDDRVEHRDSRHRYNAERNRWRDKKHDAEIRHRQERVTHGADRDDRQRGYEERRDRYEDRNHNSRRGLPANEDLAVTDPKGKGKVRSRDRRRGDRGVATPPPQRPKAPTWPRQRRPQAAEPEAPAATTPARRRPRAEEPRAPRGKPPPAVTPKPKQAAPKHVPKPQQATPKPTPKPSAKPAAKPKGKKPEEENGDHKGKKRNRNER